MAIIQKLLNLDRYYQSCTGDKIILNDLNYYNIDDLTNVNEMLMTIYDTEVISVIPTCSCGNLKGAYLLGKTCHACGTTVIDPVENHDPVLWLKKLDNVPKFINPHFWTMLRGIMAKNMDCVRWLADPTYNPPVKLPPYLHGILEHIGGVRSYDNLVNNIDNILIYLQNQPKFRTAAMIRYIDDLRELYAKSQDDIFSNYIPIVNKRLFVMENTNMGKFTNLAVSELIDLVIMWVKATSDQNITEAKKLNITAAVISKISTLYNSYFKKYITGKSGIFRKHVFGARSPFTFRAVLTSIPGPHKYDELHVPWGIGVTAFRPHILNKLKKRGFMYKESNKMLNRAVKLYDPVIAEILDELVAEAPGDGIPIALQRNQILGSLL